MSGPQCLENPPSIPATGAGAGKVEELAGLKTYVTGPPDSELAIILISDVFAVKIPIAFLGAEIDHASPPEDLKKFGEMLSSKSEFESYVKIFPGVSHGWSVRYDLEDESAVRSAEEAHRDMLDWFRMVLAKLASSDDIQAAVILHPEEIAEDEIKAVKIPTAILGAENDRIFPAEELKRLAGILGAKSEFESFVKIFPGVSHRWSMRYSLEDESAVESAEEAHRDMLDWFKRHVK